MNVNDKHPCCMCVHSTRYDEGIVCPEPCYRHQQESVLMDNGSWRWELPPPVPTLAQVIEELLNG